MSTPAPDALARILADSPISVADVGEFFRDHPAGPSFLQAITAGLPPIADDVPDDVFAATLVQAITGPAVVPPAPKTRYRGQPQRDDARRVLVMLFPGGIIPAPAVLTNQRLCDAVRPRLARPVDDDSTILRAAGRKGSRAERETALAALRAVAAL